MTRRSGVDQEFRSGLHREPAEWVRAFRKFATPADQIQEGEEIGMNGKIALLVGLGVGYVLGTRDGRERYEQLKSMAENVWTDPRVQEKVSQATETAQEKASQATKTAQKKVESVAGSTSSSGTSHD